MKKKIKSVFKKKRCDGTILTMIIVFVLVTVTVTVGEYYRIHMLQQDIEYQIQRSVNCAVEYAMGDTYRQDKIINLNVSEAKTQFNKYVKDDIGLDVHLQKIKSGRVEYKLHITKLDGTSKPAVFTAEGYAEADTLFSFLVGKIKIPFRISSTNFRTD